MTDDDPDSDGPGADDEPNRLFELYERYVGDTDEAADVYLGFGLFFAGVALALGAMGLFLYGIASAEPDTDAYFSLVKPAFAFGMLAVPVAVSGVVVLLPIDVRAVYATAGGDLFTLLAVVLFWNAYPSQWTAFDAGQTAVVLSLYALGLTLVVGSTGAALVAEQIRQASAPSPADIQPKAEEDTGESYSEEEIESDIEDAMQGVEMSWGGVRKHEGSSLSFDTDADIDASGFADADAATKTRSSGVDNQLSALQGLRGGQKNTATSASTVDDQTAKLQELREQREAEENEGEQRESDGNAILLWLKNLFQ